MLASNFVVIPVAGPKIFATQGLRDGFIKQSNKRKLLQPALTLLGHLIIRADGRLLVHRTYEEQLRRLHGASVPFDRRARGIRVQGSRSLVPQTGEPLRTRSRRQASVVGRSRR